MATRYFGKPIRRNEDPRLLTGQALFTDDVHLPGMLHVAFVRSNYAHAWYRGIDVSEAKALGSGNVCGHWAAYWKPGPLLLPPPPIEGTVFHQRTQVPLAEESSARRRAGGCRGGASRYVAEDAAERVMVNYDPLDAVVKIEEARCRPMRRSSTRVWIQFERACRAA